MTKYEQAIGKELASFKTVGEFKAYVNTVPNYTLNVIELASSNELNFIMALCEIGTKNEVYEKLKFEYIPGKEKYNALVTDLVVALAYNETDNVAKIEAKLVKLMGK